MKEQWTDFHMVYLHACENKNERVICLIRT